MKKFDPYDELEIPRDASETDVRAAYRRRVKSTHPDSGGSAKEFARTTRALSVLSDPKRRAKYDATGDIDEETAANPLSGPIAVIVQSLVAMVESSLNGGANMLQNDIVAALRSSIERKIPKLEEQKAAFEKAGELVAKVAAKFKGGKNPFVKTAIAAQGKMLRMQASKYERAIEEHKAAIAMLEGYTYEVDPTPYQSYTATTGGAQGLSFKEITRVAEQFGIKTHF